MMGEVYNSEAVMREVLEARTLEAGELARRRDQARTAEDREVLARQLREIEQQIESLQRRLGKRGR